MKGPILVIGANGYIGTMYSHYLEKRKTPYKLVTRCRAGGLFSVPAIERLLREVNPRFIINAAGYTGKGNTDECEVQRGESLFSNAIFPWMLGSVCEDMGIKWAHISTGCVFNGPSPTVGGWLETDTPNATFRQPGGSFYSGSKFVGEEILAGMKQCYILRIRLPFSHRDHPRNYLSKLLRYVKLLEVENSMSCLEDIIPATFSIFKKGLPTGVYHLTNPGGIYPSQIAALYWKHVRDREFAFFKNEEEYLAAGHTQRPQCVLASRLPSYGIYLPYIGEAVAKSFQNWR